MDFEAAAGREYRLSSSPFAFIAVAKSKFATYHLDSTRDAPKRTFYSIAPSDLEITAG